MSSSFAWEYLPQEMKTAVLDNLPLSDIWACAQTSRDSYEACLPILFRTVKLPSLEALNDFLTAVPSRRYALIRHLELSARSIAYNPDQYDAFTRPEAPDATWPVAQLLAGCAALEHLTLAVCGTLASKTVIPVFEKLQRMRSLRLENLDEEETNPFSERLAVSIAFTLPSLENLSLTRITRSAKHALELQYSNVPIATGDDEIPAHPLIGDDLRLPQLYRLQNLKHLRIRDTHLGDPMWAEVEVCCPLEVLDLGSCAHVSPAENEVHTAQILARAPPTITTCALGASLPSVSTDVDLPPSPVSCHKSSSFSAASGGFPSPMDDAPAPIPLRSLPRLRTLHLTPLVPTSALHATLAQPALAGSPVHTLSCAFHPDDAAEGCAALEEFLRARATSVRTRPRASSRLGSASVLCAEPESYANDIHASSGNHGQCEIPTASVSTVKSRARANTAPAPLLTQPVLPEAEAAAGAETEETAAKVPYPALRTLAIDIPAEDVLSPLSPMSAVSSAGRMSARRLAAAQRRAEMRTKAAARVQALAKDLGIEVLMRGVDVDASFTAPKPKAKPSVVRSRSNTA